VISWVSKFAFHIHNLYRYVEPKFLNGLRVTDAVRAVQVRIQFTRTL
jgi:hypothetical protein